MLGLTFEVGVSNPLESDRPAGCHRGRTRCPRQFALGYKIQSNSQDRLLKGNSNSKDPCASPWDASSSDRITIRPSRTRSLSSKCGCSFASQRASLQLGQNDRHPSIIYSLGAEYSGIFKNSIRRMPQSSCILH